MRVALFASLLVPLLGCGDPETYIIVTVDSRPAVHDATTLKVSLTNGGTTRQDELAIGSKQMPLTFSISAPERTGDLQIDIDATDVNGFLVGRGTALNPLDNPEMAVLLDSADFVVNTEYAANQYMSDDLDTHGLQIAAATDGLWTVAYRDACSGPCDMFARRFDATGKPVSTKIAAGTNGFVVSSLPTTVSSTPAAATAGSSTLVVWDSRSPTDSTVSGVACRAFDALGGTVGLQTSLASEPSTDVVAIKGLSNNNFVVTWTTFMTNLIVHAAIVKPDCTVLGPIAVVSTVTSSKRATATATGSPSKILVTWVSNVEGDARFRVMDSVGNFLTADSLFVAHSATDKVEHIRVAPIPNGFAVALRWASTMSTSPGRIEVYRTNNLGVMMGAPTLITDRSGSDFGTKEAFAIAAQPDGTVLVVWHACLENGDGSGCGVFGRVLKADGTVAGEAFTVPTTTTGDQTNPSAIALPEGFAVGWRDDSAQEPDPSGSAVRARIIYPDTDGSAAR